MAARGLFEAVAEALEAGSSLDRLEARGTLRLALKEGGLIADSVTPVQMMALVQRVLPAQLGALGVERVESLCERLVDVVKTVEASGATGSGAAPEDVFLRTRGDAS